MKQENMGKALKELREEKGLTQEQLANKLYIQRQAVSKWELGLRNIEASMLLKICNALEVELDDFLLRANGEKSLKDTLKEITGEDIEVVDNQNIDVPKTKNKKKTTNKDKNPNIYVDKTEICKVILNLYNDADKSKNKNKKYHKLIITITMIATIIITCMGLYIISSLYNAVSLYNINGDNGNISINNGIFVITRDKIYFDLGTINNNTDKNINDIELYYYDKDNNRSFIFKAEGYDNSNIIIHDFIGYNEYFNYDELDYILKSLTIDLTLEDDTIETISLETEKEKYRKIFLKKEKPVGIEDNSKIEETEEAKELEKLVKDNFKPNRDGYVYSLKDGNDKIEYMYLDKTLYIEATKNKTLYEIQYDTLMNYFSYHESKNGKLTKKLDFFLNQGKEDEKKYLEEFYKYYNLLKREFAQ